MSDIKTSDEQWYSTRKVAELFDVTGETVVRWIKQGKLDAALVNGRYRITRSSVHKLGTANFGG